VNGVSKLDALEARAWSRTSTRSVTDFELKHSENNYTNFSFLRIINLCCKKIFLTIET
jgi:hypothetical protein